MCLQYEVSGPWEVGRNRDSKYINMYFECPNSELPVNLTQMKSLMSISECQCLTCRVSIFQKNNVGILNFNIDNVGRLLQSPGTSN